MTYEEALKLLEKISLYLVRRTSKPLSGDFVNTLRKALKKQIPNTAIRETIYRDNNAQINAFYYTCPICKNTLFYKGQKYCICCGQAIDW